VEMLRLRARDSMVLCGDYGPNLEDLYREVGVMTGKILKGAKPADLPAERPARFELLVNLKTAKALDLNVSNLLLARANEVIE
jgi:putative tryptophan/tyrosine transport system substrate-binding protein